TVASNPTIALPLVRSRLRSGFTDSDVSSLVMMQAAYTPKMSQQATIGKKVNRAMSKNASAELAGQLCTEALILCKEAGIGDIEKVGAAAKLTGPQRILKDMLRFSAPLVLLSAATGGV